LKVEGKAELLDTISSSSEAAAFSPRYEKAIEIRGKVDRSLVEEISREKREPEWMLRVRLKALESYNKLPAPNWLSGVDELDLDELIHYLKPDAALARS